MRRPALPEYGSAFRNLTTERVRLIRTAGKTDRHWARLWRMTSGSIRDARIGATWKNHETPPDTVPRTSSGRRASPEAIPADPWHFRLLDEEDLDPHDFIDKRVAASVLLTLEEVRALPSIVICVGIYFLWRDSELLYVGQSILVGNRLIQHEQANQIPFTHHTCLRCNYDQLDTVEYDYIEHFKPPYNAQIHRPGADKAPRATGNGRSS